jgi:TonB family protein
MLSLLLGPGPAQGPGRRAPIPLCLAASLLAVAASARGATPPSRTMPIAPAIPVEREADAPGSDSRFSAALGERGGPGAAGDELVTPPVLVKPSPAIYPESLLAERIEGDVALELLLDESGRVAEVKIAQSCHPLLDQAAVRAAWKLVFAPARLGGRPTSARLSYHYRFVAPAARKESSALLGTVRAKATRLPIAGASVLLPDRGETAVTDAEGRFRIAGPPGELDLEIAAPGFHSRRFRETLGDSQTLEVVYALEPSALNPYEIVVVGQRERREVTRVTLRDQEAREVPGTMGDPFRAVMLMPGVSALASGLSYPVVRGSQPAATAYFLDGVRVPALFHLGIGPAIVHPDLVDSIDFYPGNLSAKYGRHLGGTVEANLARPRDDRLHASAYADLVNAGAFVELPASSAGTQVALAGRLSYTALLADLITPLVTSSKTKASLNFWDYQARVEQRLGGGALRLFAFGSSDDAGYSQTLDDRSRFTAAAFTKFHRADLRYRHPLAGGKLELGICAGKEWLGVEGKRGDASLGLYQLEATVLSSRAGWSRELGARARLELGADLEHHRASNTLTAGASRGAVLGEGPTSAFQQPRAISVLAGGFAQLDLRLSDRSTIVTGLRLDSYHLVPGIEHLAPEARLTARHRLADSLTLKAGAGLVNQAPTVLLSMPALDVAGLRYGLQRGAQLDLGAEWTGIAGLEVNADLYFNPLFRSVEFDLSEVMSDVRRGSAAGDPGRPGRSYGFELMVRHPLGGGWFGWISYSYQRATRTKRFSRFTEGNEIAGVVQGEVPFAYEQRHAINAALSLQLGANWTVGAVAHFNTGRPETGELTSRSQHEGVNPKTGEPAWVYDDLDKVHRLPPFFRVDLRVAKSWAFDKYRLEAYLDILNASLQSEVMGYTYFRDPSGLQKTAVTQPFIVPMLGLKGVY